MKHWLSLLGVFGLCSLLTAPAQAADPAAPAAAPAAAKPSSSAPAALYREHCAACHGADRYGLMGPALLPESLERLRKPEALKTIREGRAATQMPAFADKLGSEDIAALAEWIYTPVKPAPRWSEADIRASHVLQVSSPLPAKPVFSADPMNLFLVVEGGDHHISVLDGDTFDVIHRFATRYALHGGPKFTRDGRFVFFASRDGWITKYDLWNLKVVAEVRAGLNTRNVAVSEDGHFVAVANYLPHTLVVLDGDLKLLRLHEVRAKNGGQSSRVSAVYDAPQRQSFIAALKDVPEVWEVSYNRKAEDIPTGVIHDFLYKEGAFIPGFLNPRRTFLSEPLDDFFFTQDYSELMGASREAGKGQVVNLDARKKIADLNLPGMPHLGSGITWDWNGRRVMASPNLKEGVVSVIDLKTWEVVKRIPTRGPGFFMRSHENSRYAWVDAMMDKTGRDTLQVIDKATLEIAGEVKGLPGKTLAHIEYTRDGRYALASQWERKADGGAIVIYDAATLKELKRLPMDKPVGKYNVWNKTRKSEGTSH